MINPHFFKSLSYAYGVPLSLAHFKREPEDFIVEEELAYPCHHQGEHFFVKVYQKDANTHWTAKQLARFLRCPLSAIGYAGLKDRKAISVQWFSVHLPKVSALDFTDFNVPGIKILLLYKHHKKLRRGAFAKNHFEIILKEPQLNWQDFEARCAKIKQEGVPNYFGPQRFGHQESNLRTIEEYVLSESRPKIKDRHLKSLLLSCARSFLFNSVLSKRIKDATWQKPLPYEPLILAGSHSFFINEPQRLDSTLNYRLETADIHTSGPLYGEGKPLQGEIEQLENAIFTQYAPICEWLQSCGLKGQRRALRLVPERLHAIKLRADEIKISMTLQPGEYATTVLRELINCNITEMNDEDFD